MMHLMFGWARMALETAEAIVFTPPPMKTMAEYEWEHRAEIRSQLERDALAAVRELKEFEQRISSNA